MITREEILEIEQYCEKHSMSVSSRLDELNITRNSYYRAKRRCRAEDEMGFLPDTQAFIQLLPPRMPAKRSHNKASCKDAPVLELNDVTLELRTAGGSAMRISGALTDAAVLGIVEALNGGRLSAGISNIHDKLD